MEGEEGAAYELAAKIRDGQVFTKGSDEWIDEARDLTLQTLRIVSLEINALSRETGQALEGHLAAERLLRDALKNLAAIAGTNGGRKR